MNRHLSRGGGGQHWVTDCGGERNLATLGLRNCMFLIARRRVNRTIQGPVIIHQCGLVRKETRSLLENQILVIMKTEELRNNDG